MELPPSAGSPLPDELFRFGVEFPDGSKATTLDGTSDLGVTAVTVSRGPVDQPQAPVLTPRVGVAQPSSGAS